ncbi:hypothetical protein D3C71_1817410 [compost metagenome]
MILKAQHPRIEHQLTDALIDIRRRFARLDLEKNTPFAGADNPVDLVTSLVPQL